MKFRDKFKKVGGEQIPDVIEYIKDYLKDDPYTTISVGCDSSPKHRHKKQTYVMAIMFYNSYIKDGAHYIYYRIKEPTKDDFTRLYRESEMLIDLGAFIHKEVSKFHTRKDIADEESRKYKLHLEQHKGNYVNIDGVLEEKILKTIIVTDADKLVEYKVCDIHLDYNFDFGDGHNKSFRAFQATINWFKSSGYRTFCKPHSPCANSAADNLTK